MLKKSTKITSLVVAAATMATMVPAMATDKIADKDGNIYRAIAFEDGKFYVDGDDVEVADDEDGVFWLNGGKYEEVDSDVDSGDAITGVYSDKYLEIENGDYYFDLSTGKVTDDQLVNDDREDAASELAKKVRKDDPDRYTEDTRDDKAQVNYNNNVDSDSSNKNQIWEVPSANYVKPYYQAKYLEFDGDKGDNVIGSNVATVYTDADGKYIDADNNLGTVNVIVSKNVGNATTGAAAFVMDVDSKVSDAETIEFNAVGDQKTKDKDFRVDLKVEHIVTLAHDADYVYRLAALHVYYGWNDGNDEYCAIDADGNYVYNADGDGVLDKIKEGEYVTFGSTKNPTVVKASEGGRFYVIQKISKETDGDKDGANLPKSTDTYLACERKDWKKKGDLATLDVAKFVENNQGEFEADVLANLENVATTNAQAFLDTADKNGNTLWEKGYRHYTGTDADENNGYVILDGYVTTNPHDDGRTVWNNEDWDDDYYYERLIGRYDYNDVAYTVADGKISKYQVGFETLNDNGSADNDHEDEKFIVKTFSLKQSNGMYYIDGSKNDEDFDDEDEFATTIDKEGNIWKLDSGKIYKYKNDGDYELMYKCDGGLNELSVYDDNNLIAYNEDDDVFAIVGGKSSTGNYEVKDEETTTDTTTTAQAGWVQDATTGAWSYVKADGTKAIGWFQSPTSGLWYYMDANGVMQANGWIQDGGSWYYLKADGAMATGWVYTGGAWYFLKNTAGNMGAMQTGWIQTGGKWYYCNASGAMLSNTTVDGYVLGADGAWIK